MEAAMVGAQDQFEFTVTWQPFLKLPDMPLEGLQKPPNTPENPRLVQVYCRDDIQDIILVLSSH